MVAYGGRQQLAAGRVGRAAAVAASDPRSQPRRAAPRRRRHAADGHRRVRLGRAARPEPAVRAADPRPARAQRHPRDRHHLHRAAPAGAVLAVDRQDAAHPRRRRPGAERHPALEDRDPVGHAAGAGPAAVLPRRVQLPRAERDARARARPVHAAAGHSAGHRRSAHPQHPHDLARHRCALRPAVPRAGPGHHRHLRQRPRAGDLLLPRARAGRPGDDHLGAAEARAPLRPRRRPRAVARCCQSDRAVPPGQRHAQRGPDGRADARRHGDRPARHGPHHRSDAAERCAARSCARRR